MMICESEPDGAHHAGMAKSASRHRIKRSVCDTSAGAAFGPAVEESAGIEEVALKSDRGDLNGTNKEMEVRRCWFFDRHPSVYVVLTVVHFRLARRGSHQLLDCQYLLIVTVEV